MIYSRLKRCRVAVKQRLLFLYGSTLYMFCDDRRSCFSIFVRPYGVTFNKHLILQAFYSLELKSESGNVKDTLSHTSKPVFSLDRKLYYFTGQTNSPRYCCMVPIHSLPNVQLVFVVTHHPCINLCCSRDCVYGIL